MLNIGLPEMLIIALLAIVVVGPERLPEMMRFMGRNYAKLRRASNDLRRAFQLEMDKVEAESRAEEIKARRAALEERRRAAQLARDEAAGTAPEPRHEPEPEPETATAAAQAALDSRQERA